MQSNNYYMDKQIIRILFVINLILYICITSVLIYKLYYKSTLNNTIISVVRISGIGLITAYTIMTFIILPLRHSSMCYSVSPEKIIIHSGVIIKKKICVKTSAIQYITIVRCPISDRINFNFLLMNVYGKTLNLKFLSLNDMEKIVNILQPVLKGKNYLC